MADESKLKPDSKEAEQAKLAALVAKYQSISEPKERHKFYWDNPALQLVYSTANHS